MAEPLSILAVFPSFAVGGAQMRYVQVANRFGTAFRHRIVSMDGGTLAAGRLDPGLIVDYPDVGRIRGHGTLGTVRAMRSVLAELKPDVLVTHNWGSIEWALANLAPLVRHVHIEDGFGPEERDRQIPRRVWTRRLALRRSTVILPSRTLERIAGDIWKLPQACLNYVPNGVDLRRFPPLPRLSDAEPVIGTVAGLRPEKNVGRLVQAFALAVADGRPGRLVIVGDGPEAGVLKAETARLGLAARVSFAGPIADPAPLYAGFDAFALSSDTEQMPLTVLEAMAAGLPVASTQVGDVASMVAPENASLIAPRDAAALAEKLRWLLAHPAERQVIGTANRAKAEAVFDQETMFKTHAALLRGETG